MSYNNKTTINILDRINFSMTLSTKIMKETILINQIRYLKEEKHNMLNDKYGYKIKGSEITIYNIEVIEVNDVISLINF